ncbi:uncharacterized protein LOC132760053, partial [Ruditapes philippinarum]|uniref:uncharacterized protein LOC132760053 n=1 Tax=Ruditapes philippinarum TaxID=129788 RepID=UPI00295BDA7D
MATTNEFCHRTDKYNNWVKGVTGLKYLQNGLRPFTEKVIQNVHTDILHTYGKCGNCILENISPAHAKHGCIQRRRCNCSKKDTTHCRVCSAVYDRIIIEHRFVDPNWDIDFLNFYNDPWQFARCFMTNMAKKSNTTAEDADEGCLLSIIINGNFFQNKLDIIVDGENDIFTKIRKARNVMMHNIPQLSDDEVEGYLKDMIAVLKDPKALLYDSEAQAAVTHLETLLNTRLILTTDMEKKAIESTLSVIEDVGTQCEEVSNLHKIRFQEIVEKETLRCQEKLQDLTNESIEKIRKETDNSLKGLQRERKNA